MAKAAEVAVALVVGKDHDDVRRAALRDGGVGRSEKRREAREHQKRGS
jgi:hypothetical protein